MRFNTYTLRWLSTKNQFPKKPGFPLSTLIILYLYDSYVSLFPDVLCNIGLSVSGLRKIRFNAYTLRRISTKKKNQFPKKPGFPLSALIILDWSNVHRLLFKKESGKIWIMINKVYLAIPKPAIITCRDRKKLSTSLHKFPIWKKSVHKETRIPINSKHSPVERPRVSSFYIISTVRQPQKPWNNNEKLKYTLK